MTKKKILLITLIFLSSLILLLFFFKTDLYQTKQFLKRNTDPRLFSILQLFGDIDRSSKKLNNDYNVVFLPQTQFLDLSFKKIKLKNYFQEGNEAGYAAHLKQKVRQTFYIDHYENKIFLLTSEGQIFYNDYSKIISDNKLNPIKSNLKIETALDLFINDDKIYISGVIKKEQCFLLNLYHANISNLNNLEFDEIFSSKECAKKKIQSGKIAKIYGKNSLLLSTAADLLVNKDQSDPKPQDDNSIYGKILEIDLDNKNYKIFSKGHRNVLGLFSDKNIILATENGPRGGDEINKIMLNKNYGWDKVSYGYKYKSSEPYSNLHEENGFIEPIYAFIPSIGISQIVKIDDNFSKNWDNNFLIASLNGNHLYRIKFDKEFEKVFFIEEIYIGERIRDLIFLKEENVILLALESSGSLGILKK